jgi:nitrate reductase NapE component
VSVAGDVPGTGRPGGGQGQGPTPDPSGPFSRLARVFLAPVQLFAELRAHPRALGALVLGVVLSAVAAALIPVELWEAGLRAQMEARGAEIPADTTTLARVGWVSAVFVTVVAWPLLALLTTGVYGVVFLFLFGYEGSFRVLLSVVAHALLVVAAGALVLVPLRILAGDPHLTLSVATLLPFLGEGFLLRFAGLLDLFNLWAYVLVGVGAAVMDGRRTPAAGVAVALGVALLLSLLLAAVSGTGGMGAPGT